MREKRYRKGRVVFFLPLLFLLALSGCEYRMQSLLPAEGAKIAIPYFLNRTFREDLDEILTGEVIDRFLLGSSLQIVPQEEAEYLLEGEIRSYLNEVLLSDSAEEEHRVTVKVFARLFQLPQKKLIWEEEVTGVANYSISSTASLQTEYEAMREACQEIARQLLNLTLEGWRS
ncbi:hypothetical protein H5U35_10630 [Candidatus Aerophobetes bacterium]|nr:hypothetical protein [Candidatus Aerophobetes bacterium]